jgi:hypothetical protein
VPDAHLPLPPAFLTFSQVPKFGLTVFLAQTQAPAMRIPSLAWLAAHVTFLIASFAGQTESNAAPTARTITVVGQTFPIATAAELQEEQSIAAEVKRLLKDEQFDQLDALARKYREAGASYPSGLWKLDAFYTGTRPPETNSVADWEDAIGEMKEWVKAKPASITAQVALAGAWVNYAWKERGHAYADKVSPAQWKVFESRIALASAAIQKAVKLQEHCPVMWFVVMRVGLVTNMERKNFDTLFERATKEYPKYWGYYFARANQLLERWGGQPGEMESDLGASADKLGGEDGDLLYTQVVANQMYNFPRVYLDSKLSWPRTQKGLAVMAKRYADSVYAKNLRALLIARGGAPAARPLFEELKQCGIEVSVWRTEDYFKQIATAVYQKK